MVVNIMGWRPWPPNSTRKFKVALRVHSLECLSNGEQNGAHKNMSPIAMMIKVKWKGSKSGLGHRLRGSQKRARTTEKAIEEGSSINWQEDFEHLCALTLGKDTGFLPFDVQFIIIQIGTKGKAIVIGKASMNLGDFAPSSQEIMKHTIRLPILCLGAMKQHAVATLVVSVNLSEVRLDESLSMERIMPPSLHCLSGPLLCDQQIRGMYGKKIKNMKRTVSLNWKRTSGEIDSIICHGKLSSTSEESSSENGDLYDTDSINESEEDKVTSGEDQMLQSYGPLAGVNLFVEGAIPKLTENRHVEENATPSTCSKASSEASANETSASDSDQSTTMRSLLSWKKRKLGFRPRSTRGEPLLNKAYGEDGGDDIDRDRRISGYPIEPCCSPNDENAMLSSTLLECLDFGEELFSVGSWEKKDLVSRDGNMKLSAHVFFASIDQRSERADGESACTALVAVIADWLHKNADHMPIKAEFDMLIREGSAEWRKLCDVEAYRNNFPDRHFDLDTVVSAKVRPLVVDHERSFVGFFQPEGLDDSPYNFLQGAKSFDDIWVGIEETLVLKPDGSFEPAIYIVSWNDHFFILKVCKEAYYIIDTLGERLYEGCNQAYILRFDTEASLCHMPRPKSVQSKDSTSKEDSTTKLTPSLSEQPNSAPASSSQPEQEKSQDTLESSKITLEYKAKDACKEFVKGFFAALPIRELQTDIKKGLLGKNTLHQRLQVEFHFTSSDNMTACGSE